MSWVRGGLCRLTVPLLCALTAVAVIVEGSPWPAQPSLGQIGRVMITTVNEDFDSEDVFRAAVAWHQDRLLENPSRKAPYLACAEYEEGRQAMKKLEVLLSKAALRRVSNHKAHGTCFFVTASSSEADSLWQDLGAYRLTSFGPMPSSLKLAPGLLNHEGLTPQGDGESKRLLTTHGNRMQFANVEGLEITLSPGVLPAHDVEAGGFISALFQGLMSASMDLHANSFWSNPAMSNGDGDAYFGGPASILRGREWRRAADVVHELSTADGGPTPGDVCSWGDLIFHHAGSDILMIKGMDNLLHLGRGAGGTRGEESDELQVACLMGLVSFLAVVPEVQRISPLHASELKNAVAGAIIQSGNIEDKPLTDAGLDGTGEVIQIIDTGLDETSCFFIDEDGLEVEHGYYFEELGFVGTPSAGGNHYAPFEGGSFPFDLTRRKVVQYIRLVREDEADTPYTEYFSAGSGRLYQFYSETGFGLDAEAGHGTHTAGSAAGATLATPANTSSLCDAGDVLGCIGECMTTAEADAASTDSFLTWNTLCPQFDCDSLGDPCLDGEVAQTLTDNGGVARGAKISIFDVSIDGSAVWGSLAENGLWNATSGTGCMLHANSWGGDADCNVDAETVAYDTYMYENPEHLLLFAAGNEGDPEEIGRTTCTINIPGIGKNVLAVGASSSGSTRWPLTADDGEIIEYYGLDHADIDTVSFFSSYGLTRDSRIKPEVVAPGDQVLSAGSDGTDSHSCQLTASFGTSMATPIVAGAAAMIRQYFRDAAFYEDDVTQRGLCAELTNTNATNAFACEAFRPSAATVKAMLVNSADLMGGDSEPDGYRGFGRVRLDAGLPMGGEGDLGLFVLDAFEVEIEEYTIHEYKFNMTPDTSQELRATLAWIDPPASAESSTLLINDLDLTLVAPDGVLHRMWSDGADVRNVIERVVVSSGVVGTGTWTVAVSCFGLLADTQPYSLVVTGPIDVGSGAFTQREATGGEMGRAAPGVVAFFCAAAVVFGTLLAGDALMRGV